MDPLKPFDGRMPTAEEIEAVVAPYRGRTIEQAWKDLDAACAAAARELVHHPDRERIVAEEEPPHPTYREIILRLMREARPKQT